MNHPTNAEFWSQCASTQAQWKAKQAAIRAKGNHRDEAEPVLRQPLRARDLLLAQDFAGSEPFPLKGTS